jgi:hypothetical protein
MRGLKFFRAAELRGPAGVQWEIMRRTSSLEPVNDRCGNWRGPSGVHSASESTMEGTPREIFDEQYRVVAVESQSLIIRGVRTGKVLTISPATPLREADYPPGRLIALSDPTGSPLN